MSSEAAREVAARDAQSIVEYVDGILQGDELEAFEARVLAQPELARALEAFLEGDVRLHERWPLVGAGGGRNSSFLLRPAVLATLAVAAQVLAVVSVWFVTTRAPERSTEERWTVGIRSYGTAADYQSHNPTLQGMLGLLQSSTRGSEGSGADEAQAKAFVATADELLRQAERRASTEPLLAIHFLVTVDLRRESSVLVIGFGGNGKARWLRPEDPSEHDALENLRLTAGRHCLPSPPLVVAETDPGRLEYSPGFAVYESERELQVVVAARAGPVRASELREIDARVMAGNRLGALSVMRRLGFLLTEFTVSELP